ncbi:hypothetical protein [Mucilaginibacter pedocola]|uniref:Uncharacterized protein n=1 Tax=Mucilaginibacter pedocola TaxID=1792845 RepID=A0A1S9P872_9SPHI|nr:hypothetical protein [Mucilaginibacter pedocola]OOQ57156.1 hypothetical protein BC343_16685 [Mucilaginibacter pedocola]
MNPASIQFLDEHRHIYTTLMAAGIIKHLDMATRQRMVDIIRLEFAPNYISTLWCQPCVIDLVKFAYAQYDKWLAENTGDDAQ